MPLSDPSIPAPRAAFVVADTTYRDIASDESRAHLLDVPDSLVIPYSAEPVAQVERVLMVREQLVSRDLMATDQLLVRSPYDSSAYEFLDQAIETFVIDKYHQLALIAAHLGASSIKFVKVEIDREESDISGDFNPTAKVAKAGAKFARSMKKRLEGRFEAATELVGKEADVEAARTLMLERNLSNDPVVKGLIELCASGNPMRNHHVKINGLRESTRSLKAGIDLTANLGVKFGGGGNFVKAAESINSVEVTTEIGWSTN